MPASQLNWFQRYGVTSEIFEPAWAALIYTFRKVLGETFALEMERGAEESLRLAS